MAVILKNGKIITPNGTINGDIRIEGEKISQIAPSINAGPKDQVEDCAGKTILPGVIDPHVHYYMKTAKGRTVDNFETGTVSAAFGGVTSYVDFASPIEGKTLLEALKERENEAKGHSFLDYSFHMEVTGEVPVENYGQLKAVKDYGVPSVKIYTTYGSDQLTDDRIPILMKQLKELNMLLMVHAEDNDIVTKMKEQFIAEGKTSYQYHGDSRPAEAEIKSIQSILKMAEEVGASVYIAHVSTGEGAKLLQEAKKTGRNVKGETCPHYLLLTKECYKEEDGQKYIMTPPLRTDEDRNVLWESIANGTLTSICTDHCSFHIKDKLLSDICFKAIPGIGGSETLLPVLYTEAVGKGKLTLEQLVQLLSTNAAKTFGLYPQKGILAEGSDADIVIFDTEKEVVLHGGDLHSAAEYTVFEGYALKGYPVGTMVRGKWICKEGKLLAQKPEGKMIHCSLHE